MGTRQNPNKGIQCHIITSVLHNHFFISTNKHCREWKQATIRLIGEPLPIMAVSCCTTHLIGNHENDLCVIHNASGVHALLEHAFPSVHDAWSAHFECGDNSERNRRTTPFDEDWGVGHTINANTLSSHNTGEKRRINRNRV